MHGEDTDRSRLGAHRSCLGSHASEELAFKQALNDNHKAADKGKKISVMIVGTKTTGTKGIYGQGTKDSKEMKFKK